MGVLTVDIRREVLIFICNRGKYISRILKSCFYFWTDINEWKYEKKVCVWEFYSSHLMQFMSRNFVLAKNKQSIVCNPLKVSLERKCIWFEFMFFVNRNDYLQLWTRKKNILWFLLVKPRANIELCTVLFRVDNNVLNFKSSE